MNLQVPWKCRMMVHLRKDVDIVTASEALVGPMTAGHYFERTQNGDSGSPAGRARSKRVRGR